MTNPYADATMLADRLYEVASSPTQAASATAAVQLAAAKPKSLLRAAAWAVAAPKRRIGALGIRPRPSPMPPPARLLPKGAPAGQHAARGQWRRGWQRRAKGRGEDGGGGQDGEGGDGGGGCGGCGGGC